MPHTKQPYALLTLKRISELTMRPVSVIEALLSEHPEIQPTAIADFRPIFNRDGFLRIVFLLDQQDGARQNPRGRK
ncbi:hypothetical protein SH668x_001736 [Planctomicrobium sp. SH668]|uniref:hypothetical protein n=1 Tax=Planctomicrobium sp. SH668 TaxID=3448126 RepID=UPI003F5B0D4E